MKCVSCGAENSSDGLSFVCEYCVSIVWINSSNDGNNFLVNDSGGFSNERLGKRAKDKAEDILKVNLVSQSINDMDTLGMIGCITNKGGLYHPDISSFEKEKMEEVFQIELMEGTVNFGLPLVGAGIVANSNGAVCGRQSTGVELGRMEEALKLF